MKPSGCRTLLLGSSFLVLFVVW
ncbi:hypothetical protein OIU77_000740 [Salix suchowensis]|uniref:Uncharacterized protein n=1 Tax=Salix suchowensis TaxID=1278906 RepID=A0ABQ9B9M5_9ROSI|nr:hypothetical protein OIU77_000740 [Salix suchowensis]